MKNKILLERLYQVITKCSSSPIYQNLTFSDKYDNNSNYVGSNYNITINNQQVLHELKNINSHMMSSNIDNENLIYLNISVNKIKNPYKRLNKYRKDRFDYSVTITPMDIMGGLHLNNNNVYYNMNGINNEQIKFIDNELCKKFYEAMCDLFILKNDTKAQNILKGLDKIIEHNTEAKREIGLEKLMDDE